MFDLLIRGGAVADGAGREPTPADIGIVGDRIAAIGDLAGSQGEELDATGLLVAPGFIDIHSHSDYTLLADPRAVSAIYQGVTTEVVGNCGHGCFPIRDPDLALKAIYGYSDSVPLDWNSASGYFSRLEQAEPALNVVSMVPHGQLRLAVVGLTDRPSTEEELEEMSQLLRTALDEGAWGLSTGLEYATEAGASESEVTRLCAPLAERDDLYVCHARYRDAGAPEGVAEAIRTARVAGVRLQVSHLVPRSGDADMEECLELVDEARRHLDVAFDLHTRLFGFTYLYSVLPPWAMADGPQGLASVLADADARRRMKSFRSILSAGGDWERIVLLDHDAYPDYGRRSIRSIAAERGQEGLDCIYDLLLGAIETMESLMVLIDCHNAGQHRTAFAHPLSMPASDATTMAPDGPLAGKTFHGAYTWASYFYNFSVNQEGVLTPGEAAHRLSGLPAQRLGLVDRGVLKQGAFADIAVFDPTGFREKATRFEPNVLAEGMVHVLVNGQPVLRAGSLSGTRSGRVLRR
ncbi:MAG: amidohydrolase family protein [bacterium]|nr:amidohydrolase family protein [Acidimicrobiia bacterium]MCY4651154.1 amidohydrolase family protein [bacterium]